MITFNEEGVKAGLAQRAIIKAWIKSVAEKRGFKVGEINYIFCSDEYILNVNRQYLQHDYYTDIITFDYTESDYSDGGKIAGDIFISVDTVRSNSQQYDPDKDYERELRRVVIHGILHLCGLKDKSDKEAAQMREAEDDALKTLAEMIAQKN